MSQIKRKVTQWVVPGLFLLMPQSALAQTQFTTTPSSLNVAGTREAIESRTLLLQSPQPIDGVAVTPSDLNRTDGVGVLPASLIQVTLPQGNKTVDNQPLPVSIRFPLNRLNRSGEFSGSLLLTHTGGQQVIPITVKVKDAPWLPLFLLLIGISLGTGLSLYRSEGKTYDESVVQVGRLRTQMRTDARLAKPFAEKIEGFLVDVETALANKQFSLAQQAISSAQAVWDKWRKGRTDWIVQLDYQQSLMDKSADIDPEASYMQTVRAQLEDASRAAVDQDSPVLLRNTLQGIQQQLNRYLQGKSQLEELNQLRRTLTANRDESWRQTVLRLEQQLSQLSPDAAEAFEQWQASTKAERQRLLEELQQEQGAVVPISRDIINVNVQYLKPVPAAQPFSSDSEIRTARQRLRGANTLSHGIVVGLLAIAGFNQLYLTNPVFGASLGDYFALLAWGFGAEATSESIAKVMQRWGLPGNQ